MRPPKPGPPVLPPRVISPVSLLMIISVLLLSPTNLLPPSPPTALPFSSKAHLRRSFRTFNHVDSLNCFTVTSAKRPIHPTSLGKLLSPCLTKKRPAPLVTSSEATSNSSLSLPSTQPLRSPMPQKPASTQLSTSRKMLAPHCRPCRSSLTDLDHSTWIGLSSSVILFNKWILDTAKFRKSLLSKLRHRYRSRC